jgi:hypothetical protein
MGAMMSFLNPGGRTPLVGDLGSRRRDVGREGHAPVAAVLLASAKADEAMAAPKSESHGPLGSSSLQIDDFFGIRKGSMMLIMDPSQRARAMVSESHAPVVAVLVPLL